MKNTIRIAMSLFIALALFLVASCSEPCSTCNGTGSIVTVGPVTITCPTCGGSGRI